MSKTDDLSQSDSTLGVFVRGLLMGVAELVPGVSGGTIAFISGISVSYTHLTLPTKA